MPTATWNGVILAQSDNCLVVEGNHYFPKDSLHREYFQVSQHSTICPWKGTASYYDVIVKGQRNDAAAWYYPDPKPAAKQILGRVAFWRGIEVS